jgi:hypothetical protein
MCLPVRIYTSIDRSTKKHRKQAVLFTFKMKSNYPIHFKINTTLYDKVCQLLTTGWWFSPGTLGSSTK